MAHGGLREPTRSGRRLFSRSAPARAKSSWPQRQSAATSAISSPGRAHNDRERGSRSDVSIQSGQSDSAGPAGRVQAGLLRPACLPAVLGGGVVASGEYAALDPAAGWPHGSSSYVRRGREACAPSPTTDPRPAQRTSFPGRPARRRGHAGRRARGSCRHAGVRIAQTASPLPRFLRRDGLRRDGDRRGRNDDGAGEFRLRRAHGAPDAGTPNPNRASPARRSTRRKSSRVGVDRSWRAWI